MPLGQKTDHPRQADTGCLPGKGQTTNHGAAETARAAGSRTEPRTRGSKKRGRQPQRPRPEGTRRHPSEHSRRQAPTNDGGEHHPRRTPPEQATRPPTPATRGTQQEMAGSHTHRTPSPRNQRQVPIGRAVGNTHKAHHRAGRATTLKSANTSPHPKKAENNTQRGLPRNLPTSEGGSPPRGAGADNYRALHQDRGGTTSPGRTLRRDRRGTTHPRQHSNICRPGRAGNTNRQTPSNHDRRTSGETQTGPHATNSGQEWRGSVGTHAHTDMRPTRPKKVRLRPNPYPDTDRKPQPRQAGLWRHSCRHTPTANHATRTQTHVPRSPTKNKAR